MEIIKYTEKMELVKKTVSIKYYCDKCKDEIKYQGMYSEHTNKIYFSDGAIYPEGGSVEYEQAYFCDHCKIVVKKLLEDNGVVFTFKEKDY